MRYVRSLYDLKLEVFFQLWTIFFSCEVLKISLRSNAPPKIMSSTPPWYLLLHHQCYSLKYTTHATHTSKPNLLPMLAHHPCHTCLHATHVTTLTRHPCKHVTHATHASMLPTPHTLARHSTLHVNHVSKPFLKLHRMHSLWSNNK